LSEIESDDPPVGIQPRSRGARAHGKVGVRDVARLAGVSTATVSRALNSPARVSSELQKRIDEASKALGWVPHGAARTLTTGRSKAIGVVFPALSHGGDFARAVEALQRELKLHNYMLLLGISHHDLDEEFRLIRQFVEFGADALILVGAIHRPELTSLLEQHEVPWIDTFVYSPESHGTSIGPDNRRALRELTEYLIGLGHRRFGLLGQGTTDNDRTLARAQGIQDALQEHGLELRHALVAENRWGLGVGREMMRKMLASKPRPTAVICANALLAAGAMIEALSQGVSIPDDMSIVGYDDIELMSELPVTVTTVRIRSDEIVTRAARLLMARLEGREIETEWEVDFEIVRRASVGPPPGRQRKRGSDETGS
jgi:LacI family transcriptional regulator